MVGMYMFTYFWGFTAAEIAFLGLGYIVALVAGVSLARPISQKFDKRTAALGLAQAPGAAAPLEVRGRARTGAWGPGCPPAARGGWAKSGSVRSVSISSAAPRIAAKPAVSGFKMGTMARASSESSSNAR